MIEQFKLEYENFFDEPDCETRWRRLKSIFSKDYDSFRVLFLVETLGMLDRWAEPTPQKLNAILRHKIGGGQHAIKIGDVIDLFQPVWPLEVAKYDFLVYRASQKGDFPRRFFITGIRCYSTALVQAWWAFETIMNDLAAIIAKERDGAVDPVTAALLDEKRHGIDKSGSPSVEPYFQPLLPRLQFIYRFLTGEDLDRASEEWRHLVGLKDLRDAYVHKIGKGVKGTGTAILGDDPVLVDGFSAVRRILSRVLTKTPELVSRFAYRYLAFWSCGSESPFIWDGSEGGSLYLGLGSVDKEKIAGLFAPFPGSFSATRIGAPSPRAPVEASVKPSTRSSRKHRRTRKRRGR